MLILKLRPLWYLPLTMVLGLLVVPAGCKPGGGTEANPDGYLLCFWNVENFFDDQNDHRHTRGDATYDAWFAKNPEVLRLKLSRLCEALTRLNGGRGPDILALAEVESVRAAELLRAALNERLKDEKLHYPTVLMKEKTVGRHITPAIITRLPVRGNRTRMLGKRLRILEGRVVVDGKELIVVASHWTSRLARGGDKAAKEKQRSKYGSQIFGTFKGMYLRNPKVDFLVCGDFNDTPQDPSVTEHLRATGDRQKVLAGGRDPWLLNLMADKNPDRGFGTYFYRKWSIYDQIVVSPGLLDEQGWSCDPDSVRVVNTLVRPRDKKRRPWRFGTPRNKGLRGYSDHFPVTVRLKVHSR
jgi:endonuclease/exonuclease/phosphatase family metal-dependent hydrolase